MDKKSLIGLLIIGVILFGFAWYNGSQQKEYEKQKAIVDSINLANKIDRINEELDSQPVIPDSTANLTPAAQNAAKEQYFGEYLYNASQGTEKFYTIENDLVKMVVSNKGGRVATVELKNYKRYNGEPLLLFAESSSKFDLSFYIKRQYNDMQVNTADYYFTPVDPDQNLTFGENDTQKTFALRLNVDSLSYVEYLYTVYKDNYMVDFDVRFVNMENVLSSNQRDLNIIWENTSYQNEKGFDNENNYTTIAYNYPDEKSIEEIGLSKEGKSATVNSRMKWVAFKQQFFSSVFISDDAFQNGTVEYTTYKPEEQYIKNFIATLSVPFTPQTTDCSFQFYFGPNKFSVLNKYKDLHMERLVPLGWGIIGWINRLIVIPTFDILGKFISSYGLIILIMTIIIKIIIAPLTYKSYLSSAKMRLLKPDIDKLNEKYPKPDDALKKQQAMMELYKSAGANPMGGCLPLLIQFPILIAMFRFFPASIELRGQHFLWADDLSSYDSILNLPFDIPFYGSHVSLFALLMALSVYISSKINYNQTAAAGPQMAGMKFMMLYLMPLMLLFWFNNYSSGLSYYYLLSNIITIGQTYAFRYAVNDQKLHQKMKENAKKPKKKSKWQQRYDEMLKAQQQQAKRK